MVDPVAPTFVESRDSQPVPIPIGVIGDTAPSIVSREGYSDCEGDQDPVPTSDPLLPPIAAQLERFSASFEWLASVDLESLFAKRACLMTAVPRFMKGAYRSAMRTALAEIDEGRSHHAILRASCGWKLLLLLPRLLLHRSFRGGKIPKAQLQRQMEAFSRGEWASASERESSARGVQASARRQRRPVRDDVESRAAQAAGIGAHGRVIRSSPGARRCSFGTGNRRDAGHAAEPVEASSLVAGSDQEILDVEPGSPFVLDPELFAWNIRSARRGAAAGPSGMAADHVRVILESAPDTSSFSRAAQDLARAQVPPDVLTLLRMGSLTASENPGGGVCGIVCGDIVRRLVARTIAQSITPVVEAATSPFQHALATKSGEKCVAHAIQSLTVLDMSIDGISAFDLISRAAMLDGLSTVEGGDHVLPFVLRFYSEPSQYLWSDDCGVTHVVHQGEGGEQGDALMPMLYALGQHSALESIQESLLPDEHLCAFLDVLRSEWVPSTTLSKTLWRHMPELRFTWGRRRCGTVEVTTHLGVARCKGLLNALIRTHVSGEAMDCQRSKESVFSVFTFVDFVKGQLRTTKEKHRTLFERVPSLQDLQSAWLLLLF